MITDALAVIGLLWLGTQAQRLIRWKFFTDRDGNSGRSARHWSKDVP